MAGKKVTIALVQMSMGSSQEDNFQRAVKQIKEAANAGAQIVALPELFLGHYFPQREHDDGAKEGAHVIPGPLTERFGKAAKEHKVVIVGGSVYEADKGKYYNTSVVIDSDGKFLGKYRKNHIPHDPCFWEKNYFEPGNLGFPVFDTKYGKVAVGICYDQWFPEASRSFALNGADIIFYPTAIGFAESVPTQDEGDWLEGWVTVQRGQAIANGVYLAAVNRVGNEGGMKFWGNSFVSEPFGVLAARGSRDKEEVVLVACDFGKNKLVKDGWMFFKNRRPDQYSLLTKKKE